MRLRTVSLIVFFFVNAVTGLSQGRLAAPQGIGCDRNELTAYTGVVTKYARTKTEVKITIRTDEATTETVSAPIDKMRIGGAAFQASDFPKIETRPGVARGRVRVTAWVCNSGAVVLDWANPSPQR